MPKEETIELIRIKGIIGEKTDLPSLVPTSSLISRIRSLMTKTFGVPQLIHLYGGLGLNKTITLNTGENSIFASFTDGQYLYIGLNMDPGKVVKIDLETFTEIATLTFTGSSAYVSSLASDGTYLYACTEQSNIVRINLDNFTVKDYLEVADSTNFQKSRVIFSDGTYLYASRNDLFGAKADIRRIDLETFTIKDTLTLSATAEIYSLWSDGQDLYAGIVDGTLYKVNLSLFTEVSSLNTGIGFSMYSLFSDGIYLYAAHYTDPGKITKINLNTFSIVSTLTLDAGENKVVSLFSDSTYLYAGLYIIANPGKVAVIDLNSFTKVTTITLAAGETNVGTLFSDGIYLYAGTFTSPGKVIRKYIIPSADAHQRKIDSIKKDTNNLIASVTNGSNSHTNDINEQDVLEFPAATQDVTVYLDMVNITQVTTIREYVKVDGSSYRQITLKTYPTDFDTSTKVVSASFKQPNTDYKITLQSSIVEGSVKSIPYTYELEPRS